MRAVRSLKGFPMHNEHKFRTRSKSLVQLFWSFYAKGEIYVLFPYLHLCKESDREVTLK